MDSVSNNVMYKEAMKTMKVNDRDCKAFSVRVGVHQGSVLSPLLFIVLEAVSVCLKSLEKAHLSSCYMQMI